MQIQYGVKITTTQTGLTDYNIGLIEGVLKWATGREDLGEFKNGIIVEGTLSEVSQEITIAACGSYSTMSGFGLRVDNAFNMADRVWNLGLNLVQADAVFYSFRRETSDDEWEVTEDWTGKVLDSSYDENEYSIQFMDSFRGIHKPISKTITEDEFTDAPSDSIGKEIPISIGLVTHAKSVNISSRSESDVCANIAGNDYKVCACISYNETTLAVTLKTGQKHFAANDPSLVKKYLSVFKGASDLHSRRIISNTVSTGSDTDAGVTVVTIDDALVLGSSTQNTGASTSMYWSTGHYPNIWWFEINSFGVSLVVSRLPIFSFEENETGAKVLEYYDTDLKAFTSVSDILDASDVEDIEGFGFPGVSIISTRVDVGGDISVYFPVTPTGIEFVGIVNGISYAATHDLDTNKDQLIDVDESTFVNFLGVWTGSGLSARNVKVTYDLELPSQLVTANYEAFLVLIDQLVTMVESDPSSTSVLGKVTVKYSGKDIYGSATTAVKTNLVIPQQLTFGSLTMETNQIPLSYYDEEGNNADFYTYRDDSDIKELINDLKAATAYPVVRIELDLELDWGNDASPTTNIDWRIFEIALLGQKTLNVISDTLYNKVKGETFQSTWSARKTAGQPILNPVDMIEHLMREYDNAPDSIDTASFDVLSNSTDGLLKDLYFGRQITEPSESFDLIKEICQFAFVGMIPKNNGKRAAKYWLDATPTATHNDSNGTILENSIGEKKPTSLADLYNEPQLNYNWNPETNKADSLLKITRLEETEFPAEYEFVTPGVNLGSFTIEYVYPVDGKYQIVITTDADHGLISGQRTSLFGNADGYDFEPTPIYVTTSDSFRFLTSVSPTATLSTSGTLVKAETLLRKWKTFAIGYENSEYDEAKTNWDLCKLSVTRYGLRRSLPVDMADAKWFPNVETDWGLAATHSAAKAYMRDLCRWTPFRKNVIPYRLPNTAEHSALELLDCIAFSDSTDREGAEVEGLIARKAIVPGLGKDYIEIELMLKPDLGGLA